jgi:hypothetical protein
MSASEKPVSKSPGGDRSIDRLRDSAISMKVGRPEDGAAKVMVAMKDALYGVHERAIYAIRLADQIDPERTNVAVPNTYQQRLALGTQDPEVGRIFLTAHAFFKSIHLGESFSEKEALKFAFEYLQDIAAMKELRFALDRAVEDALRRYDKLPQENRNLGLPVLGDAGARCDAFAQKVGHAVDTLKAIARLFYPEELKQKWIDSLTELASKKYGEQASLTQFMRDARPTLLFLRDLRNMVEHPKDAARLDVYDFKLLPSMQIVAPSVEIVRAGHETVVGKLSETMGTVTESLLSVGEMLMAQLATANARPCAGFPLLLVELPPDRRPSWNPHQRLSYGIELHGEIQPLG